MSGGTRRRRTYVTIDGERVQVPNYLPLLDTYEGARVSEDGFIHHWVQHDEWCSHLAGTDLCDCDPIVGPWPFA